MTATDVLYFDHVVDLVKSERVRQIEKWGTQHYEFSVWLRILLEEVGEAVKKYNDGGTERDRDWYQSWHKEIIHIAAVTVAWLEDISMKVSE